MKDKPCGPLRENETVILFDRKDRSYVKRLRRDRKISIRGGALPVDDLIGREEGSIVRSSVNEPFLVFRPTFAELIPALPRQAQVIYPKDIALILLWGDIFPGALVVEAGVGPGALTLALLRAVGPEGKLVSYEIREDFAEMARKNVAEFYGAAEQWTLKTADVASQLEEKQFDRVLLDLPEPWRVTEAAWTALRPGGIFLSYLPTVLQVKSFIDSLREHGGFSNIETMETLMRFWHVKGISVRPQHRMVAHSGFIIVARRLSERTGLRTVG